MIGASLKPNYDAIKWVDDDELFEAWCEGRTGYPVVDAAMMQMNTTGKTRGFESVITCFIKDICLAFSRGWS